MRAWSPRERRAVLVVIAGVCLAAGAIVLYAHRDPWTLSTAGTPAVAGLLGLIVLPGATLAARRLERRAHQRAAWSVESIKTDGRSRAERRRAA